MKIKYCIIIALLAFLFISIVVSVPYIIAEIRYENAYREELIRRNNLSKERQTYFEELKGYCKEHEAIYMEISEQFFGYLDEGLPKKEVRVTVEDNATLEQKEILDKHSLYYPDSKNDFASSAVGLAGNELHYGNGDIKIVYFHQYSEELEEKIMSAEYTTTEKINDHLYVCYTEFPYTIDLTY